ncbi:SDR family oxidoreductase [Nocardioidaceae bacterium]|nr:SDR family oxidoreductase [Nocardioidaceae bacterium]
MSRPLVVVTGAAAGIGRATALRFAREGYDVGAYDLDESGLSTLGDELSDLGAACTTGVLDVRDADAFSAALGQVVAERGRLDVLVNNAGVATFGRFADADPADLHRQVDVNCKGVLNGAHAGFEHLRRTAAEHGTATMVNMASASAIYGQPELACYSATKFFVRGLTEALDLEWGPHDIRVVDVWPLFVATAMTDGAASGAIDRLGIRLGPDDVAAGVLAAVRPSRLRRATRAVHHPVGPQTKVLAGVSSVSPGWASRLANKLITRS